jgi:hypothetical protein
MCKYVKPPLLSFINHIHKPPSFATNTSAWKKGGELHSLQPMVPRPPPTNPTYLDSRGASELNRPNSSFANSFSLASELLVPDCELDPTDDDAWRDNLVSEYGVIIPPSLSSFSWLSLLCWDEDTPLIRGYGNVSSRKRVRFNIAVMSGLEVGDGS